MLWGFFPKNSANCIVIADVSAEQLNADNRVEQAVRRTKLTP